MFKGKESSNRIELSRLVQDLLNFGVLGSLQLWGGGRWVGGIWGHGGCPYTDAHTHACTHTHMHIYTCIEIANGRGHGGIHVYHVYNMFNMHVRSCVCMRACMGHPPHTHTHPHPHPPIRQPPRGVDPRNHLKFDNTSTYQDISIPFERFEICEEFPTHEWVCGLVGGWVVGWVDGWGQVKSLKI